MSNSSQSANAMRYRGPEHALRIGRGILPEGSKQTPEPSPTAANSLPDTGSAGLAASTWQSVLWFFLEGFALYGASVHWVATTAVTVIASEVDPRQRRKPTRDERQKSISLVSPAARPQVTVLERREAIDQTAHGIRTLSARDGCLSAARGVDRHRSVHPGWLAMTWCAIAGRWAMWRRERAIKEAVIELAEYDDRMLLDMGFAHRSQIEEIVRNGRDC